MLAVNIFIKIKIKAFIKYLLTVTALIFFIELCTNIFLSFLSVALIVSIFPFLLLLNPHFSSF